MNAASYTVASRKLSQSLLVSHKANSPTSFTTQQYSLWETVCYVLGGCRGYSDLYNKSVMGCSSMDGFVVLLPVASDGGRQSPNRQSRDWSRTADMAVFMALVLKAPQTQLKMFIFALLCTISSIFSTHPKHFRICLSQLACALQL